jgi:hypothetical protein
VVGFVRTPVRRRPVVWQLLPQVAVTRSEALVALKAHAISEATQPLFVAAIADLKTARTLALDDDVVVRFVEHDD